MPLRPHLPNGTSRLSDEEHSVTAEELMRIAPALRSLPSSPKGLGACIELTNGTERRYISLANFHLFAEAAGVILGDPDRGLWAARRHVALSRLLAKPHFLERVRKFLGLDAVQAQLGLIQAAARAPLLDHWQFEPILFSDMVRRGARGRMA